MAFAVWFVLAYVSSVTAVFAGSLAEISLFPLGKSVTAAIGGSNVTIGYVGNPVEPQKIFRLWIGNLSGRPADIRLSTCATADDRGEFPPLDTTISLYSEPLELLLNNTQLKPDAESAADCRGYATLDYRWKNGNHRIIVVSSSTGKQGRFRLRSELVAASPSPTPLPWGLDRIDQRLLPLDDKYSVTGIAGRRVYVYVLDSGVRASHAEFQSWNGESTVMHGVDVVERLSYAKDCTGHGTHVAGIVAGNYFGVAKNTTIISVRVLGCDGIGYVSRLVEGLQFALEDVQRNQRQPAVVCMSLTASRSKTINRIVDHLFTQGIPVVAAAGNHNEDSCSFSPASANASITVAASSRDDSRPPYSNTGQCVNLFAPGNGVISAWNTGDHAARVQSGTSAAAPHVAGAIALLLSANPTLPALVVATVIYSIATPSSVTNRSTDQNEGLSPLSDSSSESNRLLYVKSTPAISGDSSPPRGIMYVYAILGTNLESLERTAELAEKCPTWLDNSSRREKAISTLIVLTRSRDAEVWMCCPGEEQTSRCGADRKSIGVGIRISQLETVAFISFKALDEMIKTVDGLEKIAGGVEIQPLNVEFEPWVVDSDGNIFWAAPDVLQATSQRLSIGAQVMIGTGVSVTLVAMITVLVILMRKKKQDEAFEEYRQAIENFESGRENQRAVVHLSVHNTLNTPREAFPRSNTALLEGALARLSSTCSLQTPNNQPQPNSVSDRDNKNSTKFARQYSFGVMRSYRGFTPSNRNRTGRSPWRGFGGITPTANNLEQPSGDPEDCSSLASNAHKELKLEKN